MATFDSKKTIEEMRSAFPNIKMDTAWEIYCILTGSLAISNLKNLDNLSFYYAQHNIGKTSFAALFTEAQPQKFQNIRFEYQLALYLAKKTPFDSFKTIYYDMLVLACFNEFLEWYEYLVKNILRQDVQKALDINLTAECDNWLEIIRKSELIGWAFNPVLFIEGAQIQLFMENIIKVHEIGKIMKHFFNHRKPLSIIDDEYFESDHVQFVFNSIEHILINRDFSYMEKQIHNKEVNCMIETIGWHNEHNMLLVWYIYQNFHKFDI